MITLTEEQQTAVKNGKPVVVPDPDIGDIVVTTVKHLKLIQEAIADQEEQQAVLRYSMRQAGKLARENPY